MSKQGNRARWWVAMGVAAVAGASVAVWAASPAAKVAPGDRAGIEAVVRSYILDHPEIITEAMDRLQARELAKVVDANRSRIETPFAGAWAGNPRGDVVLVEFFDYACGYCRAVLPDVERLIAEDKNLKVVFRELPVLSAGSDKAARVSLSAAKQGRFVDFHRAMYRAGSVDDASIAKVQTASGLSAPRVASDLAGADVAAEIDGNVEIARALKMSGTPTFVVGDQVLYGLRSHAALKAAIAEARKRG